MPSDDILMETQGGAVHLILNRTTKANALTQQMWDELPDLISYAQNQPGARALVLRSATDEVFCAGADVAEYRANAGGVDWGLANHRRVTRATNALAECNLATVARIAGPCAGGAVGLITACDLRFCSRDSVFSIPPARLGLVYPQADTARLVDLVGPSAAKRLLLTAARMDALNASSTCYIARTYTLVDTQGADLPLRIFMSKLLQRTTDEESTPLGLFQRVDDELM